MDTLSTPLPGEPNVNLVGTAEDETLGIPSWDKRDIAVLEKLLTDTRYREKHESQYVAIMNGESALSSEHISMIPDMVRISGYGNHGVCAFISKAIGKGYQLIKVGHLGDWHPENAQ